MTITLHIVSENDASILRNLYSLYLHDLSKFTENIDIDVDGVFHFDGLDSFWEVDGISPYFIKKEESVIGFLLLLERPYLKKDNDYSVNDIFILNKYKGKGLGTKVLEQLFNEKSGKYYVIELVDNLPAVSFWKNVYKQLHIEFEERNELVDEERCLIQTFTV